MDKDHKNTHFYLVPVPEIAEGEYDQKVQIMVTTTSRKYHLRVQVYGLPQFEKADMTDRRGNDETPYYQTLAYRNYLADLNSNEFNRVGDNVMNRVFRLSEEHINNTDIHFLLLKVD